MTDTRLEETVEAEDHDVIAEHDPEQELDDLEVEINDDDDDRLYFDGDTGTLRLITRKALVLLLKRTHVAAYRHPREYQAVVDDQDELRSRLNDLFLELIIDPVNEVAYKRQAGQELGRAFPTLLINRSYTRDEIAILLRIRDIHHRAKRDGEEAAFVERADLLESLRYIRPADTKDQVRADAVAVRAIERLTEDRFLQVSDDPDRLRVSPVIETLLTVEQLQAFTEAIAEDDPSADRDDPPPDDRAEAATEPREVAAVALDEAVTDDRDEIEDGLVVADDEDELITEEAR